MLKLTPKLKNLIKQAKLKKTALFSGILPKLKTSLKNLQKTLELDGFSAHRAKVVTLVCLIALSGYIVLFQQHYAKLFLTQKIQVEEKSPQEIERARMQKELKVLVKGHPIERMIPYIATKDKKTIAYLIGIAKQESNWGERRPVLAGVDCYNYWGFRAERDRMGSGGHTCFNSPREAVAVVSKRIAEIIEHNDADSAQDMLVWKCGSDCSVTGGQVAANNWAQNVDFYAEKVLN